MEHHYWLHFADRETEAHRGKFFPDDTRGIFVTISKRSTGW